MEISICDGALESRLGGGKAFYCDMTIPLGDQRVEFAHHLEGSLLFAYSGWEEKWIVNIVLYFFPQGGRVWVHNRTSRGRSLAISEIRAIDICFSNIISNVSDLQDLQR